MTLADIRTEFLDWLNRSDCTTARATTIIQRAQARIQREVRVPAMESSISASADSNGNLSFITIPGDFLEAQRIIADGKALQMTTPEHLLDETNTSVPLLTGASTNGSVPYGTPLLQGGPEFAARVQGQYNLWPYPQSYATLYYYGSFGALVADTDTNTLLTFSPDVLRYAALSYAGDFFRMDERSDWETRYQAEKEALRLLGQDADMGGGPMTVTSAYDGGYL